jgi:hypothetical protein
VEEKVFVIENPKMILSENRIASKIYVCVVMKNKIGNATFHDHQVLENKIGNMTFYDEVLVNEIGNATIHDYQVLENKIGNTTVYDNEDEVKVSGYKSDLSHSDKKMRNLTRDWNRKSSLHPIVLLPVLPLEQL